MPLPYTLSGTPYPLIVLRFAQSQVAISQTNVALRAVATQATNGFNAVTEIPMLFAGSIWGLGIAMNANKTAGTLTVTPTINGVAITSPTSLVNVALANAAKIAYTSVEAQLARFKAGDRLGLFLNTNGSLAPTTNDLIVDMYVTLEEVKQ